MNREEGYYWVRTHPSEDWMIGYWNGMYWHFNFHKPTYSNSEHKIEIDPTPITRNGK